MALSEADREWVKLIARELAFEAIKETLVLHVEACPHGKNLGKFKAWLVGVIVGCTLVGGGGGYVLAKLIP